MDIASRSGVRVTGLISEQQPGTDEQNVDAKAAAGPAAPGGQ